jgi:hypothetical protein
MHCRWVIGLYDCSTLLAAVGTTKNSTAGLGTEGTVAKQRSCRSQQLATDRPVFSSLLTHTKQDATGGYGRVPVVYLSGAIKKWLVETTVRL